MENKVKAAKSEKILLGMTAAFLCVLAALWWHDQADVPEGEAVISAEVRVPREVLTPAISLTDINTATEEELAALPGIGEELARRIAAYRAANGSFKEVEQLLDVKGIGEGRLAELEGWITIGGEDET